MILSMPHFMGHDATSACKKMENAQLQEKLLQEGWNLTSAGLDLVSENGKITDFETIVKKLLDVDLRSVSQGTLPEDINKTKYENIPGGIVLQLQKVKNLSSPKYQEIFNNPNPSIMKFVLTDGMQSVQGVAMEAIPSLHLNTLPGSKILLTGEVEIAHCFLMLTQENTSYIGGRVEQLIEKWELNRKLAKHRRDNQEEGGPPPWIPFGQKIAKQIVADKNFKSLEQGKPKEVVENSEFEAQRKGAILEAASKIGAPKVFGGGNNKLLDHNVQVIVDAGFTVEQAEYALKLAKNNTDRALRSLQSKISKPGKEEGGLKGKIEEKGERSERGGKGGKGRGRHREEDGASSLKPSAKVSLFDFLEDKLPVNEKELTAPSVDFRNNYDRRGVKPGKPGTDRGDRPRFGREDQDRPRRSDGLAGPGGRHETEKIEKKPFQDRKTEVIRFEGKKPHYEQQRNDKSFGNFKVKNEFMGKTETGRVGPRWNEKRDVKPGGQTKSYGKSEKTFEEEIVRKSNFVPTGEKPPRFQKMANQQGEGVVLWNESPALNAPFPRLPPHTDLQLQNSLANLSLQQSIANHAPYNHTSQDHNMPVPPNVNKNMFYQNVGVAATPSEVQHRAPPPSVPPQSVAAPPPYQRRSPAAPSYLPQDLKTTAYPGLPSVPDYPYKTNGTMMQGFNDFQAVFGNAPRATNNAYNSQPLTYSNTQTNYNPPGAYNSTQNNYNTAPPTFSNAQPTGYNTGNTYNNPTAAANNYNNYGAPFLSAQQLMQPPPPTPQQGPPTALQPRRWSWKKGHKCYARYWEDQNYYEALVTGVSENTCVVHFTEYGNYEEVLHDDCVPIDGISPET